MKNREQEEALTEAIRYANLDCNQLAVSSRELIQPKICLACLRAHTCPVRQDLYQPEDKFP